LAFWRREPKTHEKIGIHAGDLTLRICWAVAAVGVMIWAWSKV
jgi:hypothetical protein